MSWVWWAIVIAYSLTVLSVVAVVLSENRNPVKSLAWVTVLLLLPVGGILLYGLFGRSLRNTRMISRRNRRRLMAHESPALPPDVRQYNSEGRQQIELGHSLTGSQFYPGNQMKLFHDGASKFESMFRDIEGARHSINLQYYIIEADGIGSQLQQLLIKKAHEGVRVRVIYDHFGSIHVRDRYFTTMRRAGIEVLPFFRVAFPMHLSRINWRNHRKMCVIDGRIGYVGGMNVADRYITGGKFDRWRDTHMRIEGPAVSALHYSFAVDWNYLGQPLPEDTVDATPKDGSDVVGMQLMTSGPTSEWSNVELMMLKAIGNAKKRVYIQTPYFLPTDSMLRTLQAAALSRVDVRVMMPWRSDSWLLTMASYSYVHECLRAGIKIYLYRGGMLHSKTMVIDDDVSSVGSANIDFRSFEHNFECTMMIYSPNTNRELRHRFEEDMELSERLRSSKWRRRPLYQKVAESVLRLLSPIL